MEGNRVFSPRAIGGRLSPDKSDIAPSDVLSIVLSTIFPVVWFWLPRVYDRWPQLKQNRYSRILALGIASIAWNAPLVILRLPRVRQSGWSLLFWLMLSLLWWRGWWFYLSLESA